MIIRDVEGRLEVLMAQRTSRAVFGATAWVFPGGRVDAADEAASFQSLAELDDATASTILGVDRGGLAWWYAALRETWEEAGLVIGAEVTPSELEELRGRSQRGDPFHTSLQALSMALDASRMFEVARFITPVGPPRRYDTRFFLSLLPQNQVVRIDENEIVDSVWIEPAVAIERWQAGEFPLMSVTHRMLACLDRHATTSKAIAAAAQYREPARVRVNDPHGAYEVLLPGEPGYDSADLEIEHGWVRL